MFMIFIQGFILQASLILALGAQNIFVLNSGLRKQRHLLVATVCTICDAVLIFIGVLGVATFFIKYPLLKIGLGSVGVGFLLLYGILKLKEANTKVTVSNLIESPATIQKTILMSLGFSLLNPHVYLDTVVLVGGYSTQFKFLSERFYFGFGASAFSAIWFFGLTLMSSVLSIFLNHPKARRQIALVSGMILIVLAFKLGSDVYKWSLDL